MHLVDSITDVRMYWDLTLDVRTWWLKLKLLETIFINGSRGFEPPFFLKDLKRLKMFQNAFG